MTHREVTVPGKQLWSPRCQWGDEIKIPRIGMCGATVEPLAWLCVQGYVCWARDLKETHGSESLCAVVLGIVIQISARI